MRIAIAADDQKTVAAHFGRCRGFVIADVEPATQSIQKKMVLKNTFTNHLRHQSGIADSGPQKDPHAKIMQNLRGCQMVVSHGIGRKFCDDLQQANITPLITDLKSIDEVLIACTQGELLDHPDALCDPPSTRDL